MKGNKTVNISHPTGNQNVRAVCKGFLNAEILKHFYTSIAVFPNSLLYTMGGIRSLSELRRRNYATELRNHTKTYPVKEAGRLLAAKAGMLNLTKHETGLFSVDAVYRHLDKVVARKISNNQFSAAAMYAYEDGAAYSFAAAKQKGIMNLYDLPIGYWRTARKLLTQELEKFPEWAATLTGFKDSAVKLARKDEELRLADHIFVASSFTAATLNDYPGKLAPVSVIPYGFPEAAKQKAYTYQGQRPLKALFVGGLSQRKGLSYLFESVRNLGSHVDLTVVGNAPVNDCVVLNTCLKQHRWIPSLPHAKVLELMREQDVLIFPSLFEGFGLVITEAMAQGTPVITTTRTAGPDIIQHNCNGWIVEAASTEALTEMLATLIEKPALIKENGLAALATAASRPWTVYGQELADAVAGLIQA